MAVLPEWTMTGLPIASATVGRAEAPRGSGRVRPTHSSLIRILMPVMISA